MSETPGQRDRQRQEGRGASLLLSLLLSHSRGVSGPASRQKKESSLACN